MGERLWNIWYGEITWLRVIPTLTNYSLTASGISSGSIYEVFSTFLFPGFGQKSPSLRIYRTPPLKFNCPNRPQTWVKKIVNDWFSWSYTITPCMVPLFLSNNADSMARIPVATSWKQCPCVFKYGELTKGQLRVFLGQLSSADLPPELGFYV